MKFAVPITIMHLMKKGNENRMEETTNNKTMQDNKIIQSVYEKKVANVKE